VRVISSISSCSSKKTAVEDDLEKKGGEESRERDRPRELQKKKKKGGGSHLSRSSIGSSVKQERRAVEKTKKKGLSIRRFLAIRRWRELRKDLASSTFPTFQGKGLSEKKRTGGRLSPVS